MRKFARRLVVLGVSAAAVAALAGSPAQAATNPYTPAQACNNDFGGSWASTTDGHRTISDSKGAKVGDVYLMYNSATGDNCVTTIKAVHIGTATWVHAGLLVQGGSWKTQGNDYKYYAAVKANATDKCVQYDGVVDTFLSGRYTWGNCG
ncbi:hypothetical protein JOL79_32915 [Microbispora sp. RL4-1S]|uniref:SH3 domain-containing protein n=1 Tax=Microbispora oryzae TaxID=2806554 RepID=A0A941ANP9_9ACTN|nr:hypothetical protein [Microbispora oryzae]MBP2708583.1 hypothetical protein [Microbispora oryzae]